MIFSANSSAYFLGCQTRNGPPKHGRTRGWFFDAHFSARYFRGVSTDEVKYCELRSERANRRQHSEGIAGQENHIGRMAGYAGMRLLRMKLMG